MSSRAAFSTPAFSTRVTSCHVVHSRVLRAPICWWQHISNADVLQRSGLHIVTSCLIVASTCSVTLPAWTQVCQRMLPFSWWWIVTRACKKPSTTWTRLSGRPRRTWLNHIQDADARPLSTIWRWGDLRLLEVTEERNGPSGLRYDDDDDDNKTHKSRLIHEIDMKLNIICIKFR